MGKEKQVCKQHQVQKKNFLFLYGYEHRSANYDLLRGSELRMDFTAFKSVV